MFASRIAERSLADAALVTAKCSDEGLFPTSRVPGRPPFTCKMSAEKLAEVLEGGERSPSSLSLSSLLLCLFVGSYSSC